MEHPLDPVLGHDDGDGEVVDEPGDGREHLLGAGRVEGGGRLVEQEDPRVRGEHRADGDPLLLAAGQLAQRHVAQLGDAEQVEGLLDPLAHRRGGQPELLHPVGELLLDGVGDEPGQRVLADDADEVGEVAGPVVAGVAAVDAARGRSSVPPVKCGTRPQMAPSRVDLPDPVRPTTRASSPSSIASGRRRAAPGRSAPGRVTETRSSEIAWSATGTHLPPGRRAAAFAAPAAAARG